MAYQQHLAVLGPRLGSGGFQYMNSLSGNTAFTKVFVGGLAWETQSETMKQYFEQFGEILEAVVITDKHTGRSKGYGFDALETWNHTVEVYHLPGVLTFEILATSNLLLMASNKAWCILSMVMLHTVQNILILRAYAILLEVSNSFKYMAYLD